MPKITAERQHLIHAVEILPDEVLTELTSFLDYLSYKTQQQQSQESQQNFLLNIAGLGHSGEHNISELDEEILKTEINPLQGWHHQAG
ncbi:hypothetical protein AWQ21_14990 (plasmid) [Picosynechococcus sp. PCC 7003]|uniref:hypothetical protein n=1 Tax=Picosynechococcus sp. PCC 7003 TaxID=374981 RepID=UPI000810EB39|nr:hypothetical protein [Picosynechococcus sp. PCC 7003]ANV85835.1 hypothetical protein AWQ21_14990 [Picosynechococcus sp. PCC 7003]